MLTIMSPDFCSSKILESLRLWPFETRNKIEDSQMEETVKKFESSEHDHIRSVSKEASVLFQWEVRIGLTAAPDS